MAKKPDRLLCRVFLKGAWRCPTLTRGGPTIARVVFQGSMVPHQHQPPPNHPYKAGKSADQP